METPVIVEPIIVEEPPVEPPVSPTEPELPVVVSPLVVEEPPVDGEEVTSSELQLVKYFGISLTLFMQLKKDPLGADGSSFAHFLLAVLTSGCFSLNRA